MEDELQRLETMRQAQDQEQLRINLENMHETKPSKWGWLAVLIAALVFFGLFMAFRAHAQSPEEMYQEYITPETQAVQDRFDEAQEQMQAAEEASDARKSMALVVSLLVGLIPIGYIGRDIIRKKTWKENPSGTVKAAGIALAGGAVLFGINYGIFLLKFKMGDAFNTALAFLLVAAMIVGCIYLLRKQSQSGN